MKNIAVIIVNYNGLEDTLDCIKSIRNSTVPVNIYVVDNASQNDEAEEIRKSDCETIVIESKENLGFSGGNNLGIRKALEDENDFIMLLNNDTVIAPDLIEKLCKDTGEFTMCVPMMYYYDNPNELWYGGGYINKWTGNAVHYTDAKRMTSLERKKRTDFASGCCMMLKAETIRKVGFFEESYFMYGEDTDFCIRCLQAGIRISLTPEAKLWHKVSRSTGGKESGFCIYYITRNRLSYIIKYSHFFHFTAYPFSVVTRCFRMLLLFMENKQEWKAFRKGIRDFFAGIVGNTYDLG